MNKKQTNKFHQISKIMTGSLFILTLSQTVYAVPEEIAIPRLVELSQIPTQASINEVIALAQEGSTNEMRQQFVFTALVQIGPSNSGDEFARSILDDDASPIRMMQGALGYLAEHPESWMVPYAEKFIANTYDGSIRSMAAYLAGSLNLTGQIPTIKEIITNNTYGNIRNEAVYGLARLVPVTEFDTTIDASNLRDWDKTLAKTLNQFWQADEATKDRLVGQLLGRSEGIFPVSALRYILENNKTELIQKYIVRSDDTSLSVYPVHQNTLRTLGYEISGNINAIVVTKKPLL